MNPKSESSKLRSAAEQGWLDLVDEQDLSTSVLRLGGIYGPGRRLSYDNTSIRFTILMFCQII